MNDTAPWYLKFIYTFGIPAALTVYLVWFIVNSVDARLQVISNALDTHQREMASSLRSTDEMKQQLFLTNLLLQSICVNTASNQAGRNGCFKTSP